MTRKLYHYIKFNTLKQTLDRDTIEFLKHGKNYLTASVVSKGLKLISIPIMTRLLSPSDYGILAIFGVFIAILKVVFGFGIRGAVTRYYYEKTNDFGSFLTTNILFVMGAGVCLGIIILLNRIYVSNLISIPQDLVIFSILIVAMSGSFSLINAYLIASKQSAFLSHITITRAVSSLILTIIITLLLKEHLYLGLVYSSLIFSFIFFLFTIYMTFKIGTWNINIKHLKYSLIFGLPMILHGLSGLILNSFDIIMISKMIGSHETGLYSFAYKVAALFQIITVGLNQAWAPIFYEKLRDNQYANIERTVEKFAYIISGAALLITMLGPLFVTILAPKIYSAALSLIPIIIVGFIFQYFYFMYINYAFYAKKTSMIATITLISGLLNIGLNYWLLPIFGYTAAAWTTVITYALFFLMQYINVSYNLQHLKKIPLKLIGLPGLFSILLIVISTLISHYIEQLFILLIAQFSLILIYLMIAIKKILN